MPNRSQVFGRTVVHITCYTSFIAIFIKNPLKYSATELYAPHFLSIQSITYDVAWNSHHKIETNLFLIKNQYFIEPRDRLLIKIKSLQEPLSNLLLYNNCELILGSNQQLILFGFNTQIG